MDFEKAWPILGLAGIVIARLFVKELAHFLGLTLVCILIFAIFRHRMKRKKLADRFKSQLEEISRVKQAILAPTAKPNPFGTGRSYSSFRDEVNELRQSILSGEEDVITDELPPFCLPSRLKTREGTDESSAMNLVQRKLRRRERIRQANEEIAPVLDRIKKKRLERKPAPKEAGLRPRQCAVRHVAEREAATLRANFTAQAVARDSSPPESTTPARGVLHLACSASARDCPGLTVPSLVQSLNLPSEYSAKLEAEHLDIPLMVMMAKRDPNALRTGLKESGISSVGHREHIVQRLLEEETDDL